MRHLLDRLRKIPVKDRASVPGLSPERADIIVAGLAIIDRVMDRFEVNSLQVHNRGVRDGLVLSMIDQMIGASGERPHDRDAAIERLAANCGCEMEHSRHVARLAGSIYAQLAEGYELNPNDRELLEAAARLQDVGYLINYDQHHKHSYHLILHSRLETFKPNELELIANVARYHRGADPKQKHANFRQLSARDQARVRQMAAVLRVAGGLDRSNTQLVSDVRVIFKRDGDIELRLTANQYPEVDIWAARKRQAVRKGVRRRVGRRLGGVATGESARGQRRQRQVASADEFAGLRREGVCRRSTSALARFALAKFALAKFALARFALARFAFALAGFCGAQVACSCCHAAGK